jgi:flagellar protein FliS
VGFYGAQAYQHVNTVSGIDEADPHRRIQMLLDGAIEKTNRAKYFMQQNNRAKKGEYISWAISIINGLQSSLNMEKGGNIAKDLDQLYSYCIIALMESNAKNDLSQLESVLNVIKTIQSGWNGIRKKTLENKNQ